MDALDVLMCMSPRTFVSLVMVAGAALALALLGLGALIQYIKEAKMSWKNLLLFLVVTCVGVFIVVLFVILLSRPAPPPVDNSLNEYRALVPGASRRLLRGFDCYQLYMPDANYCELQADGTVRAVHVGLTSLDTIRTVSLSLAGARLDALDAFGRATTRHGSREFIVLCWQGRARATLVVRPYGAMTFITLSEQNDCPRIPHDRSSRIR